MERDLIDLIPLGGIDSVQWYSISVKKHGRYEAALCFHNILSQGLRHRQHIYVCYEPSGNNGCDS